VQTFIRHMERKSTSWTLAKSQRQIKPRTIKNVLITLSKMLGDLGFPQRIKYTPPESGYAWIKRPEDVARFLESCTPEWFRIASALSVYAGLRKGEVAGLVRGALDFERGLIRVDKTYDGRPTKSKHERWAPMSDRLASMLRDWILRNPGEYVITVKGHPIERKERRVAKLTRAACKRAGVDPVNFHQLRHTAASHLAQRVPLPLVGAVLGHADPKTTARYAHLDSEGIARDARTRLDYGVVPKGKVVRMRKG
jgi:integrase